MDFVHFSSEAILASLAFGALHALEPGHGKTALLAYMADGSKSYIHSIIVGFASFFSHTASILLISLIVHAATHFAGEILNAETVTWYVSLCSSLVLFGIGSFMMVQSYKNTKEKGGCCGNHAHTNTHAHANTHRLRKTRFSISAILGVSVGLYPCPTAIAAYLTALANGDQISGYLAIFVYGLGIGITMMGIGLASAYMGRSFFSRFKGKITQKLVLRAQSCIFMFVGISQLLSFHR